MNKHGRVGAIHVQNGKITALVVLRAQIRPTNDRRGWNAGNVRFSGIKMPGAISPGAAAYLKN